MKLKSNLHCHTSDDYEEYIAHSPYEAIDVASKNGFDVLSFTCHNIFSWKKEYKDYAESMGILLIPGIEKTVEGKHVVILNADRDSENINTFSDLYAYKKRKEDVCIVAPHPFFPSKNSLGKKLVEYIDVFDAIEYSWFHSEKLDFNRNAEIVAKKNRLPYIATSDTHNISFINTSYALIESAEKNTENIFDAIRNGKIENVSRNLSLTKEMVPYIIKMNAMNLTQKTGQPTLRRSDA